MDQIKIWRSNFRIALSLAMHSLKESNMEKSALYEGYKEIIKAMDEGKEVVVR